MSEISVFDCSRFSKDELAAFINDIMRMLSEDFESAPQWAIPFFEAYNKLSQTLALTEPTSTSVDLQRLDQAADLAWSNLNQYLKIMVKHPDNETSEAALNVKAVFDQIDNPTALPYSVEYSALERLISALDCLAPAEVDRCGARPWFDVLKQSVTSFTTLYTARIRENSERVIGENKAARQNIITAYRMLVENANVVQRLSPSPSLESFIQHVNELIARNRALRKARKTAKAAANAE